MIQVIVIITIILSLVLGFYTIILLHRARNKSGSGYLNSFFYYQVLLFIFGFYGILGSIIIRQILPKFEISFNGIETISQLFPFIGLPFLIAGWFMQLKMIADICHKNVRKLVPVIFFTLATVAFLAYGLVIRKIPDAQITDQTKLRNYIYMGYAAMEIFIAVYVVLEVLMNRSNSEVKFNKKAAAGLSAILLGLAIFRAASLLLSPLHWLIGIYFILFFFAGNLPLYFYLQQIMAIKPGMAPEITANVNPTMFDTYKITQREQEIVIEICKGKTNQEIADALFISLQTVKDHTHNIFQKTGIKNRVQLTQLFSKSISR